jgi:hypothetical protein
VVEAVPLEQDAAGGDVDLLDDAVEHRPADRPADRREVVRHLVVDRDQRRPLRRERELVAVGAEAAARLRGRDHVVVLIDHVVDALAVADPVWLEPSHHVSTGQPRYCCARKSQAWSPAWERVLVTRSEPLSTELVDNCDIRTADVNY